MQHSSTASGRAEEEDVDSFFLPGGILDSLNHDSAESLLGAMGLRTASSRSRVLSSMSGDVDAVPSMQLNDALDFADTRLLSSAGTNPNAPEFLPKPVNVMDDVLIRELILEPTLTLPPSYLGHEALLSPRWDIPLEMQDEVVAHDPSVPYAFDYHVARSHSAEYTDLAPTYADLHPLTIVSPALYTHTVSLPDTHDSLPLRTNSMTHMSAPAHSQTHWFDTNVRALTYSHEYNYEAPDSVSTKVESSIGQELKSGAFSQARRGNLHSRESVAAADHSNAPPPQLPGPPLSNGKEKETRVRSARVRRSGKERGSSENTFQMNATSQNQSPSKANLTTTKQVRRGSKPGSATQEDKKLAKADGSACIPNLQTVGGQDTEPDAPNGTQNKPKTTSGQMQQRTHASVEESVDNGATMDTPAVRMTSTAPSNTDKYRGHKQSLSTEVLSQTKSALDADESRAKATAQADSPIAELSMHAPSAEPNTQSLPDKKMKWNNIPTHTQPSISKKAKPIGRDPTHTGTRNSMQSGGSNGSKTAARRKSEEKTAVAAVGTASKCEVSTDGPSRAQIHPQQSTAPANTSSAMAWEQVTLFQKVSNALDTAGEFASCMVSRRSYILTGIATLCATVCSHCVATLVCLLGFVLAGFLACFSLSVQLHRFALAEFFSDYYVAFCFGFPYSFRTIVSLVAEWPPHWAPVCLWYSFLVQLFCTVPDAPTGSSSSLLSAYAHASMFRVLLPLMFIAEGVTSESYFMKLSGSELLLLSFALSAIKLECVFSPIFLMSWSLQVLAVGLLGAHPLVQYCQLMLSLTSLHAISLANHEPEDVEHTRPHATTYFEAPDETGGVSRSAVLEKPLKV